MVNSQLFLLATTAYWNKHKTLFAVLFVAIISPCALGQKLKAKEQMQFNEKFFEAQALKARGDYEKATLAFEELYLVDDKNATVNFELAQSYLALEDVKAVFHAEKAHKLDSENEWISWLLVEVFKEFGYLNDLVQLFDELIQKYPQRHELHYELSATYVMLSKYKHAIEELNTLETKMGISEALSERKKMIYLELGDLDGAINESLKLIESDSNNIEYYGNLGQLYSANGLDSLALGVYFKMLEINPKDPRPHLDLANYYKKTSDFEKSKHHLKIAMHSNQLELKKKIPVLLSLFSASSSNSDLLQEAYSIMDTLIEQNANDPRIYSMYGDFLSRDGKDQQAIAYYKKALALEEGNKYQIWEQMLMIQLQNNLFDSLAIDAPKAVDIFPNQPLPYFFAGAAFNVLKNYEEALYYLESGLNYVIGNPALKEQFYSQLAEVHYRLGNYKESDGFFDKAIALNSTNALVMNNYAYYLSLRKDKLDRALSLTEKSNRISPNNPTYLDTWAWVHYQRGEYDAALKIMEKVFKVQPIQAAEVLEHYGDILNKLNRAEEALAKYQKALELEDANDNLHDKIKALQ